MKKKISYVELLKEAISEYDTKAFNVKGPMLDPIISYDGGGELQTHKDASSVLERYYFKEKSSDSRLFVEQDVQEKEPEENEIETGEEAEDVKKTMGDLEDELVEEFMLEDDEEGGEVKDAVKVPKEFEKEEGGEFEGIAENMEQAVIEKLISEMEEIETPKDEETKEAGTGLASEEEVDKIVEDLELEMLMLEAEDEKEEKEGEIKEKEGEAEKDKGEAEEEEGEAEEEKGELDVDKKVQKEDSSGLGIKNNSASDQIEEAFKLFKEQIEGAEEKDEDEKDKLGEADELEEFFMVEEDDLEEKEPKEKEDEDEEDEKKKINKDEEDVKEGMAGAAGGAAAGGMVGGPLGAVVGGAVGHLAQKKAKL
jgi:hypothetical protein